jgi:hypothetical protein
MAVTAEEEALLELMRKKRAAMGMGMPQIPQIDFPKEEDEERSKAPIEHSRGPYRTSGFLAEASPVRGPEHQAGRPAAVTPSPLPLQLPPRGRPLKTHYDANAGQNQLRDSFTSDAWSESNSRAPSRMSIPHHLPTPSAFSPLDPFPPSSPVLTASVTSPTTTEHASPLPSPVTPGLRAYENDINVKVANSDTSNDVDEVSVLETGVIDVLPQRVKSPNPSNDTSNHQRRRTASSHGADMSFPVPPTHGIADLTPVSEASFRLPTTMEPSIPKIPAKNSKRMSGLTLLTNSSSRSRQSSIHSQASSQSHASSYLNSSSAEKKSARFVSHQSSNGSLSAHSSSSRRKEKKRNSISDDVLAAWNSLGGTYWALLGLGCTCLFCSLPFWELELVCDNPIYQSFFFLCDSILIGFLYNQLSIGTGLDSISVRISYVHTCHSASQVLFAHFSIDIISAKALGMKGPRMRVDDKQTGNSSLLLL